MKGGGGDCGAPILRDAPGLRPLRLSSSPERNSSLFANYLRFTGSLRMFTFAIAAAASSVVGLRMIAAHVHAMEG